MSLVPRRNSCSVVTLVVCGLAVLLWSSVAQAQMRYSLSGNARTQIGVGIPRPITFAPPPNGAIEFPADAYLFQGPGPDPRPMTLVATPAPLFSTSMRTIPVFVGAVVNFQVRTSFVVNGPANGGVVTTAMGGQVMSDVGTAMFSAGGRTGPAIVSWCPGFPVPAAGYNPGCTAAVLGSPIQARLRYERTGAQFGGVGRFRWSGGTRGGASAVIRGPFSPAPCTHPALGGPPSDAQCLGGFDAFVVSSTLVSSMGSTFMTPGMPVTGGPFGLSRIKPDVGAPIHPIRVDAAGLVHSVGPTFFGSLPPDTLRSWAGPFTTGRVTVSAPNAIGGLFKIQGSDRRISGVGSISLVSGSVATRASSGDNANRTWLNLEVGFLDGVSVPSVSGGGLTLLALLIATTSIWMLRRAWAAGR